MPKQTIIFTALPNGRTPDGKLRLSVLVSPRLDAGAAANPTLSLFGDFTDFATTSAGIPFEVTFGSGAPLPASRDETDHPPISELWQSLFPGSASVAPFGIPHLINRKIRSFPASNVKQHLQALYTSVGLTSPVDHPSPDVLLAPSAMGKYASDPTSRDGVHDALVSSVEDTLTRNKYVPPTSYSPSNVAVDMIQVQLLYKPRSTFPLVQLPTFDFHQALGSLGSHPAMLRSLGLIVDLVVTPPANYSSQTLVKVAPTAAWHPIFPISALGANRTVVSTPQTRYAAATFTAAPRTSAPDLAGRRLRLADTKYDVTDLDLDGAALKTIALSATLAQGQNPANKTGTTPEGYGLPALRTEGIALIEKGKAGRLQQLFARQTDISGKLVSTTLPVFDAEDLVRGYYVDVWDDTAKLWSPLCARHVEYFPDDGPSVVAADEAPVTLAVTETDSGGASADIFTHEMLAKWSGWSLVAPRPGKQLPPDNGALVDAPDTSGAMDSHLDIRTEVPDPESGRPRLPSLRFGRQYRLRARAADLAGNGDAFDQSRDFTNASALARYSRYEPVPPPVVLPHEDTSAGATARRMVIRSDYDTPVGNAGTTIRHLAPPNAGQLLVEQSGVLDVGGRVSGTFFAMLRDRDGARFDTSTLNARHIDVANPAAPNRPPQYVFPGNYLQVPYLTDPFSRGVAFYGLPFGASPTLDGHKIPGGTAVIPWSRGTRDGFPVLLANRISLTEPTSITTAAAYTAAARANSTGNVELATYLPKGSVVTIRVSSTLTADKTGAPSPDIDRMGLWWWLVKGPSGTPLTAQQQTDKRRFIAAGLHWMFTPYEEVTLVHAVRRPLLAPVWSSVDALTAFRDRGETVLQLDGTCKASGRSTGKITAVADWTEQIDLLEEDGPGVQRFGARPFSWSVDSDNKAIYPIADATGKPLAPAADEIVLRGGSHELNDHRHRFITYSLDATSRFAEEFVQTRTASFGISKFLNLSTPDAPLVPGYTRLIDTATRLVYEEGTDYVVQGGGVRLPTGSTIAVGNSIDFRFLPGPVSRISTETGKPVVGASIKVNVLATARPKAPLVEYVVPAYAWKGWTATSSTVSGNVRTGNILRVWLGRPWYSSGDGEKLAVVCPQTVQPDAQDKDDLHEKVSLIGADPVWGDTAWKGTDESGKAVSPSAPTRTVLTPANFPLATTKITSGLLMDGATGSFAAAVHDVHYDADRRLWYCDIQIDTTDASAQPYTPFVQLALARFQANALNRQTEDSGDLRLSPVVLAEVIQLSPDRTLTVTKSASSIAVKVTGPSYRSTPPYRSYTEDPMSDTLSQRTGSWAGPSRMEAQTTVPTSGMSPAVFPDTAWRPDGSPTVMTRSVTTDGIATWSVTMTRRSSPGRIVLTEFEEMADARGGEQKKGRLLFTATYNY